MGDMHTYCTAQLCSYLILQWTFFSNVFLLKCPRILKELEKITCRQELLKTDICSVKTNAEFSTLIEFS